MTVSRLNSGQYIGGKEKTNMVVGEKAVDAFFDINFRPPEAPPEK